jgi:hypothetical protein
VARGRGFNELRMGPGSEGNVACPRCADAISGRPVIQKVCFSFLWFTLNMVVNVCVFVCLVPPSHSDLKACLVRKNIKGASYVKTL